MCLAHRGSSAYQGSFFQHSASFKIEKFLRFFHGNLVTDVQKSMLLLTLLITCPAQAQRTRKNNYFFGFSRIVTRPVCQMKRFPNFRVGSGLVGSG